MSEPKKESKLENLPMEELEGLAGGAVGTPLSDGAGYWWTCPKCSSTNCQLLFSEDLTKEQPYHFHCLDCNHYWVCSGY